MYLSWIPRHTRLWQELYSTCSMRSRNRSHYIGSDAWFRNLFQFLHSVFKSCFHLVYFWHIIRFLPFQWSNFSYAWHYFEILQDSGARSPSSIVELTYCDTAKWRTNPEICLNKEKDHNIKIIWLKIRST